MVIPFIIERLSLFSAEFKLHLTLPWLATLALCCRLFYLFSNHFPLSSVPLSSITKNLSRLHDLFVNDALDYQKRNADDANLADRR